MAVLNSVFLQQEEWDALAEHALTPYLPFLGGVAVSARFNYSGPGTKKVHFYVVKFETELLSTASHCSLQTAQEFLHFQDEFCSEEVEYPDDEEILDADHESNLVKAKCCEDWFSKGFEIYGVLPSDKPISLGRKEFFKTGLTSSSAKKRGGDAYAHTFFEEEIADPHHLFSRPRATRAAVIEKLIQLKLFYKFWKDQAWLYSPKRVMYDPDSSEFSHLKCISDSPGFTESLVWKNVDQKVSSAIEAFRFLNALSNRDLSAVFREVDSFNHAWRWVAQIKQRQYVYIREFLFWPNLDRDHFDKVRQMRGWGLSSPSTKELNFLRGKGFQSRWLPVEADDLNRIYELSAEQFTLPGVASWTDDYTISYP